MYHKRDSLLDLSYDHNRTTLMRELGEFQQRLPLLDLPNEQYLLVRSALADLFAPTTNPDRFTLRPAVVDELRHLPQADWPRYLCYRYRYERFPSLKILDDFPPCLQVEPTSVCNYRCTFCYQTDEEFTKKSNGHMGFMSLELFKQVIDQAQGHCEALTLASRGEPLLHPDIVPMLAYLQGKFLASKVNTNAWFLDEVRCHALMQAELNTLVLSIDAAVEPTYSQLRVGGKLERVIENVKRLRAIKDAHYPDSKTIIRVSGVKVPGTPEWVDMEAFWGEWADQVTFVAYNPWENTYQRPVNDIEEPCSDLWRRMFVWWDGTVNPCDVDYKSTLAVGRVQDTPLSDLWQHAPVYRELRHKHLFEQRSACSPCNRCTVV